jgi:ketosteroid isomerase-like protein
VTRVVALSLLCFVAATARAADDASAIAKSVGEKFAAACGAGDVKAVLALYRADARVVYPGAGDTASNPQELEKLVTATCNQNGPKLALVGYKAVWVDAAHTAIASLGEWSMTAPGPDGKPAQTPVRATEVIVKTKNGWKYAVDHASIGVPPAPPAQ